MLHSLEERFWAKVNKRKGRRGCWTWTGATTSFGHGVIGRGGRGTGLIRAHRLSYEIHKGPIPEGLLVRHTCDNPPCVNPDHLILGTHADNMRDASERKRIRNQNSDKKKCIKGHSLHDAYRLKTGSRAGKRVCRTCTKIQNAARKRKRV